MIPPAPQPLYSVMMPVPAAPVHTPPPAALASNIAELARGFEGKVGIAVRSVDDGWETDANGGTPMPQQSVSKLWVAMTVLDAVDSGRIRLDDPLVAEPGTAVNYSSFGYTLASIVMEAATGLDFLEIVAEEIVLPFGLLSLAADDPQAVVPGRVAGYYTAREIEFLAAKMPGLGPARATRPLVNIGFSNPAFCWAGAGLLATMPDLARFGTALLPGAHGKIGSEERELLFTPLTEATPEHPPLGLGWRVDADKQGRPRWHHAGTTPGGRCALVIYPQQHLSMALASNAMTTPGDVLGAASELADLFA